MKKLTAVQLAERSIKKVKSLKNPKGIAVSTVNVLKISDKDDMCIDRLASFLDDEAGNQAAEALFTAWVKEVEKWTAEWAEQQDIQYALDEGYYEIGNGGIYLTHSTVPIK